MKYILLLNKYAFYSLKSQMKFTDMHRINKHKLLVIMIICLFTLSCFLSGCSSIQFNIEETIKPPEIGKVTIQGTWKIEKYISIIKGQSSLNEAEESNRKKYVGKNAIFDNEICAIGIDVCKNPDYNIIKTSADTFLKSTYQINSEGLGIKIDKVNVVTIYADNKFFNQLIITDDMTAYVYLENGFLLLKKMSNIVDEEVKQSSGGKVTDKGNEELNEDPLLRSGVLIGVRSSDNTYYTIWINSKNRELKTVSTREQLLVPRSSSFWEVGCIQNMNQSLYAMPFADVKLQQVPQIAQNHINESANNILLDKPGAKIIFLGNDYMGIEDNLKLNVLPIDNIKSGKKVKISDIILDNSSNVSNEFKQSRQNIVSTFDSDKLKNIIGEYSEDNFTLKRRNGHWIMRSRLYFKENYKDQKYEDFDLNFVVPSTLISYDEMDIPWNNIKSKLPWTIDAFMSPNKDIAILVSRDSLNIYPVQKRNIINKQLMKIPLSDGDSVIMAEWAIGKYADIWSKFVDKTFTDIKGN